MSGSGRGPRIHITRIEYMYDDIIQYEDLLEACEEFFAFGGVTFIQDFGPWKKGNRAENLEINMESAEFVERNEDGDILERCAFKLTPVTGA